MSIINFIRYIRLHEVNYSRVRVYSCIHEVRFKTVIKHTNGVIMWLIL